MKAAVIKIPDFIFETKWDGFISSCKDGTVMQSSFAFHLFDLTNNSTPVLITCFENNGNIIGSLLGLHIRESKGIKGFFSSRVVIYGGPVIADAHPDQDSILQLLLEALVQEVQHKSIFIQIRASCDLSSFEHVFRKFGFIWSPRLNLLIDTSNQKHVIKDISSSRLRQIKKSIQRGAQIIAPENKQQLFDFYNILNNLYRKKVRKPLPDFSFFETFYNLTQNSDFGKIFLITYEDRIIGGIISPLYPGKTVYEWYVCGLDEEYKSKGIYPSVLATWAAIEFATNNNFEQFDFMGVGKPDEEYGVRDFKKRFGGQIVNYGRFIRINNNFLYSVSELGYNLLSMFKKI